MKQKLLVLMAVLMAVATTAWAEKVNLNGVEIDGIKYNLKSDGNAEVGSNAYSTVSAVVIPETVEYDNETYNVTSIASGAFSEAKATSIRVGNNVVSIGDEAFEYCKQLETLIIGTGVKTIGDFIFRMSGNLANNSDKTIIALPTSAPSIGLITDSYYYNKIVSIRVPKGSLSSYKGTQKWNSYEISEIDPTAVLEYKNFDATSHTAAVTFSVTADKNESLGSVEIPASVEKDGVTYTVTAVAENGFADCTGISAFKLPPTIATIGANAFSGCSTLTKIYLTSANVSSIGTDALATGLTIWATEAGYENISAALGNTYTVGKLKEIRYKTVSGKPLAVGTGNLTGTTDCYVYYSGGKGAIVYEGEISEIAYSAFKDNTDLQEIIFTASVGKLADGCFQNCSALTTVVLPVGITELPLNTFNGCTSLTSVKLPEGITTIYSGAFEGCSSLKTLVIPSSVGTITYDVFAQCTSDGFNLIMLPSSAPGIDYGGLSNPDNKFKSFKPYKVTVHNNAYSTYTGNSFWSQFSIHKIPCLKYQTLNQTIGTLDAEADFGTPVLAHYYNESDKYCYLEFAENPKIGANAFKGFDQLDCLIDAPTGFTSIGASAFEGCTKLRFFQVPTTVTEIGADAFKGCTGLNEVTYKGSLDDWCKITFGNAEANPMNGMAAGTGTVKNGDPIFPTALTLEGTEVKPYTFVNAGITSLDLGEVTAIGDGSFKGCASLAVIEVGATPATLGTDAFTGIASGHEVKVPLTAYTTYTKADGWKALNLMPQKGEITLADGEAYAIDKTVEDCTIHYTRTVSSDNWMGVYLPFDVDVTSMAGTYATLTGVSDGYLNWTTVSTGIIPACTPFIYKPVSSGAITFTSSDATLHSCEEAHPATSGGYTLHGNFTEITTMKTLGAYALANNAFKQADSDNKHLKPFRVYIVANGANHAPALRNRIDGDNATGIELIEDNHQSSIINSQSEYSLQGIRVDSNYKGIVIENGKKVVRK